MPLYDADLFNPPAPIARVTLRYADTATSLHDVPMLIDSGADVTLIPSISASQLGVMVDSGARYELIGFDGTRSIAQSVHLDLLFMKHTFKGRFLLVNQAWGIVGRDVLNHLAILLDGPNLTWNVLNPSLPMSPISPLRD